MAIYILEEERVLRDALVAYLWKLGFAVKLATGDAEEFERAVLAQPPRVAIVEFLLGDPLTEPPQGLGLLERLRATSPRTHVIVLTASTKVEHLMRVQDLGVVACLEKHRLPAATLAALLLPLLRDLRSRRGPPPARRPDGAGPQR